MADRIPWSEHGSSCMCAGCIARRKPKSPHYPFDPDAERRRRRWKKLNEKKSKPAPREGVSGEWIECQTCGAVGNKFQIGYMRMHSGSARGPKCGTCKGRGWVWSIKRSNAPPLGDERNQTVEEFLESLRGVKDRGGKKQQRTSSKEEEVKDSEKLTNLPFRLQREPTDSSMSSKEFPLSPPSKGRQSSSQRVWVACKTCGGAGKVSVSGLNHPCRPCKGSGKIQLRGSHEEHLRDSSEEKASPPSPPGNDVRAGNRNPTDDEPFKEGRQSLLEKKRFTRWHSERCQCSVCIELRKLDSASGSRRGRGLRPKAGEKAHGKKNWGIALFSILFLIVLGGIVGALVLNSEQLEGTSADASTPEPTPIPVAEASRTPIPVSTPAMHTCILADGTSRTQSIDVSCPTPEHTPPKVETPTATPIRVASSDPCVNYPTSIACRQSKRTPTPVVVEKIFCQGEWKPREDCSIFVAPTATPQPRILATTAPSSTPVVIPTMEATPSPVVPPTIVNPTPTPQPTSEPTPIVPHLRHIDEKQYMLELINAERTKAGLNPVELGDNPAAQLHVEDMLENCFSGHWGTDGLKPYMRYSLAGGYQSNSENVLGLDYCIRASDNYRPIQSIGKEIRDAMDSWMTSPGHRRSILRSWHRKVNIGIAWDRHNFKAIQHFEGDHVEFHSLPVFVDGILSMTGIVKNGVTIQDDQELGIQIFYDPLPLRLFRGQLTRTYCYSYGRKIASLRPPLPENWYYDEDQFENVSRPCLEPYQIPTDAPGPRSHDEAHQFWQESYAASQARGQVTVTVPWITATKWTASGKAFSVAADIEHILDKYGDGVYTVVVWAPLDGEDIIVSEYSLFLEGR